MGINWNTVPAFYNDSYTYMEWLGKVTAKVEDHETRLTQAEADIDELQEDVAGIKRTLADHEQRISKNEDDIADIKDDISDIKSDISDIKGDIHDINDDIDELEGTVGTLSTWYTDHAADAVTWVENNKNNIAVTINTTVPALQEQTSENTAAIIDIQRNGIPQHQTCTSTIVTSGSSWTIESTFTPITGTIDVVDTEYKLTLTYNNVNYTFTLRDIATSLTTYGISFALGESSPSTWTVAQFGYSISINNTTGKITLTPSSFYADGQQVTITDVSALLVVSSHIIIYPSKTVTPSSKKLQYQASVKIFTDKTIPLDSRTASIIMQYYSAASIDPTITWATWAADYNTEHPEGLQLDTSSFPDTNLDGKVDAIDASNILTYYSNASRGFTQYEQSDANKFYNWYLAGNPPQWEY